MVLYDVTQERSFDNVRSWIRSIEEVSWLNLNTLWAPLLWARFPDVKQLRMHHYSSIATPLKVLLDYQVLARQLTRRDRHRHDENHAYSPEKLFSRACQVAVSVAVSTREIQ